MSSPIPNNVLRFPRRGRFLSLDVLLCDLCDSKDDLVLVELEPKPGIRALAWRCAWCIEAEEEGIHA